MHLHHPDQARLYLHSDGPEAKDDMKRPKGSGTIIDFRPEAVMADQPQYNLPRCLATVEYAHLYGRATLSILPFGQKCREVRH
jgi:hypothetical protein